MVKTKFLQIIVAIGAVAALLYTVGALGPGEGRSSQGVVVRAEVTVEFGAFAVQLTTRSSLTGERDWIPPGRTYTTHYTQDVLVAKGERVHFWLTAATDIDRSDIAKRTLRCQLYLDGKALPEPAKDSVPVRRGEAGEPVSCMTTVTG